MTQFMIAHGADPGPSQRPKLTGAICGGVAAIPAVALLLYTDGLEALAGSVGLSRWITLLLQVSLFVLLGLIYGWIFSRAADDTRGGWLFGISFGFLVWMVGPAMVLQWFSDEAVAEGVAAKGLLGSHLAWGLFLGLLFPWVHRMLQRRLYGGLSVTGAA